MSSCGPSAIGRVVADLGHEGPQLVPLNVPPAGVELGLDPGDERVVHPGVHALVHEPAGDHVIVLLAQLLEQPEIEGFAQRLAEAAVRLLVAEIGLEPSHLLPEGGRLAAVRRREHPAVVFDDGAGRERPPVLDAERQVGRFVDLHEEPPVRVEAVGHEIGSRPDEIGVAGEVASGPLPSSAVARGGPFRGREAVAHGVEPRAEDGLDDLPCGVGRGDVLEEGPLRGEAVRERPQPLS